MKPTITVVGAIITNDGGEIFCALRSPVMSLPNKWEFPGGKIEQGESPEQAIVREIEEELGCTVRVTGPVFCDHTEEYEKVFVRLLTIPCALAAGRPAVTEHAAAVWLCRESLGSLVWAPADIPTVKKLVTSQSPSTLGNGRAAPG